MQNWATLWRRCAAAPGFVILLAAFVPSTPVMAGPAGTVSDLSVTFSPATAGATGVCLTVQFTVAATGSLSDDDTITVDVPGALLPDCARVENVVTRQWSHPCGSREPSGTRTLKASIDLAAGHRVRMDFDDVTNPAKAGTHRVTVKTAKDGPASVDVSTVADGAVSGVSVSLSTAAAGASGVRLTVLFTVSPTGGLSRAGKVTVSVPGALLPDCARIENLVTRQRSHPCGSREPSGTRTLNAGIDLPAGHRVRLDFDDVTIPAQAGTHPGRR